MRAISGRPRSKRYAYGRVTVHGFRSTFATWAEECTDYPDGVREAVPLAR